MNLRLDNLPIISQVILSSHHPFIDGDSEASSGSPELPCIKNECPSRNKLRSFKSECLKKRKACCVK